MRFSIRWLLVITAYVALLAATIGTQSRFLVDLVWIVTLSAFCYMVVAACIERGKRQAMAIGFVVMAATHVVGLYSVPYATPAARIYQALGYTIDYSSNQIYEPVGSSAGITRGGRPGFNPAYNAVKSRVPDLRTSSGVMTLVAGLLGGWIGLLAYKQRTSA
jgi:hypothetical protein